MMKFLIVILLCLCGLNCLDVQEELLKKHLIKRVADFAGVELPQLPEIHLLCLPCRLMMKQVRRFSEKRILTLIKKEWRALCPIFKDAAFCEGIDQTFIDQFATHFLNNNLKPRHACETMGMCKKSYESEKLQEYIDKVMEDSLTKEQQKDWTIQAQQNVINTEDYTVVQFADLHVDVEYTVGANAFCGAPFCCREENGWPKDSSKGAQYWGTYADCDLPFRTVQNMIRFASTLNPEFIIWTGDSTSHDIWHQQQSNQTLPTQLITDEIKKTMPETQVYAIYGNHEAYPADQYDMLGEGSQWLRDEAAEMWSQYLSHSSYYQLRKLGYYSQIDENHNLRIIALNSQACDLINFYLMDGQTDPRGMLKWLIDELKQAETLHQFAIIFAHIPPGDTFCSSNWADRFSVIVERFEHVISGIFYGHTHQDHVQHVKSKINGRFVKTLWIAPSGTTFTYQNPSFRVFQFNGLNNSVKDYTQYRLDLAQANKDGQGATLNWQPAYQFLSYYGLKSATLDDVSAIPYKLQNDKEFLQKYIYNYATGSDVLYKKHIKNLNSLFYSKATKKFFVCGADSATFDDWYNCVGFMEKLKETSFLTFKLLESLIGEWVKE